MSAKRKFGEVGQAGGDGDMDELLAMVEAAADVREMDASQLKSLVLKFEKAVNTNVEMRTKYPGEPLKFMDSEVALDDSVKALHPLATAPHLYPLFVKVHALGSLLSLTPHENSDVSISVVSLLHELLDADTLQEDPRAMSVVEALIENRGVQALIKNLERFDETQKEDAQALYNTLEIIENLIDVKPEVSKIVAKNTEAFPFLFARMKQETFDQNKLYCSEILSILLQSGGGDVAAAFGEAGGMKKIVRVIAKYRRKDPENMEEIEFVENLFNSLCFAMNGNVSNQLKFAKAEGIELMLIMIKKKKYSKIGALKALNFAVQKCAPNCEKLIDDGGLKTVFAAFMTPLRKHKEYQDQNEEHILSVISQLFVHLSDIRYLRLLRKFQENGYQKVERLVELHGKYSARVNAATKRARGMFQDLDPQDADGMRYLERVDAGLFTLQLVCFVLGFVATCGDEQLRKRVKTLFEQHDMTVEVVREIIKEYAEQLAAEIEAGQSAEKRSSSSTSSAEGQDDNENKKRKLGDSKQGGKAGDVESDVPERAYERKIKGVLDYIATAL